jgi:uncharacterized protein (DUF1697 family)
MRYAALLRGINVGGAKQIGMNDLRDFALGLGLENPRTLLQSGNLVFDTKSSAPSLEKKLETATSDHFGVETKYFLRSAAQWSSVVKQNPFSDEAESDPGHLVVMFLRDAPPKSAEKALTAAIVGREIARVIGHEAYVYYRDGIGTSKLTLPRIEKALGTSGTGRNWNTTLKIGALMQG